MVEERENREPHVSRVKLQRILSPCLLRSREGEEAKRMSINATISPKDSERPFSQPPPLNS
jgi:hypothetical protein